MKRCRQCRRDLPLDRFHVDRSRADGRVYVCIGCRLIPSDRPSKRQRMAFAALGLAWCRGCRAWVAAEAARGGQCRKHINESDRSRYATNPAYRVGRRQHAHARKRGVAPIPAEAQADLMAMFGGLCAYCPEPATTWDHIVPISRGGRTTPGNVVPCCASCNSRKRDRDADAWLDDVALRGTANPALPDRLALAEAGLFG